MDYCETNQGTRFRICLTDEELQMPAVDEICNKYFDWLENVKESKGGRKTRSVNRKVDSIYEDIMSFKLPPIKLKTQASPILSNSAQTTASVRSSTNTSGACSSIDSDSDTSSRPITRSLRSRSRTPVVQNNSNNNNNHNTTKSSSRPLTSPSTPQTHHKIRAYMKQPASGGSSSSGTSNVLSAALNQQHPSVSVTKIRQLLRADSAQKKRDEEKERHERMMIDRKAKEDRAEAQKKQLLEERAVNAKLKREQRLRHAAEVRKARAEAKQEQKLKEEARKNQASEPKPETNNKTTHATTATTIATSTTITTAFVATPAMTAFATSTSTTQHHPENHKPIAENIKVTTPPPPPIEKPIKQNAQKAQESHRTKAAATTTTTATAPTMQEQAHEPQSKQLNGTFRKPSGDANNIEISIQDETTDEQSDKVPTTAVWARAPQFREALIKQFSKSEEERLREVLSIFPRVTLPVELEQIFGSSKAVSLKYICRTSSAVWSPPHKPVKRTSSMVMTPNKNEKR